MIFAGLQELRPYYEGKLTAIKKPSDFTPKSFTEFASTADDHEADILAGLACCVGNDVFETTLCAANGAGHKILCRLLGISCRSSTSLTCAERSSNPGVGITKCRTRSAPG